MFHEDFEFDSDLDPGGTLLDMINLTGLKFPPRGVEDTEAKTTGHLNSLMGSLIVYRRILKV